MRIRLLEDNVLVYRDSEGKSEPFLRLPNGLILEATTLVKKASGNWIAVVLPDKQTGFIAENTKLVTLCAMRLKDGEMPYYSQPEPTIMIDTLKSGEVATLFMTPTVQFPWYHIMDASYREGFLPGNAKITQWTPAIKVEEFASRWVGLANTVIGLVIAIGAIAITIASFSSSNQSGSSFVFIGAIAFGLTLFGKGVSQLKNGAK